MIEFSISGRISLRKSVMYQPRVSLQTYGLGENMAKNPSKDPHIQGLSLKFFTFD